MLIIYIEVKPINSLNLKSMLKTIKPETLNQWLINDEVYLIDVREPQEYKAESIKQSHLIPLSQFSGEKVPTKAKKIAIHCRSGMRSRTACERLLMHNPEIDVYNLEGGILAWNNAGLPVAGSNSGASSVTKCSMSIERQTQLVVGILVLFGTIFGLRIITAFVGIGLIMAAFSGWCGLSKFLNKMPWNN